MTIVETPKIQIKKMVPSVSYLQLLMSFLYSFAIFLLPPFVSILSEVPQNLSIKKKK